MSDAQVLEGQVWIRYGNLYRVLVVRKGWAVPIKMKRIDKNGDRLGKPFWTSPAKFDGRKNGYELVN